MSALCQHPPFHDVCLRTLPSATSCATESAPRCCAIVRTVKPLRRHAVQRGVFRPSAATAFHCIPNHTLSSLLSNQRQLQVFRQLPNEFDIGLTLMVRTRPVSVAKSVVCAENSSPVASRNHTRSLRLISSTVRARSRVTSVSSRWLPRWRRHGAWPSFRRRLS